MCKECVLILIFFLQTILYHSTSSHNMASKIRTILGTMTFGHTGEGARIKDKETVQKVLDLFKKYEGVELDTARMYCDGNTEKMLGELKVVDQGFKVATKVMPHQLGQHDPEKLKATFHISLAALQLKKVDLFYLHAPDYGTPIEKTLRGVQDLYEEGLFTEFGVSNYSSWQVAEMVQICKLNGWVVPTVYQGMYNALTRNVEPELFPCLKKYNIRFYAYNPLAGGAFSPSYKSRSQEVEPGSRFDPTTNQGKRYRLRYWNDVYFEAIDEVHRVCAKNNLSTVDVALRWVKYHSKLSAEKGDGIIIGASSVEHTEQNLRALEGGPLPAEVLEALDSAWDKAIVKSPPYFR